MLSMNPAPQSGIVVTVVVVVVVVPDVVVNVVIANLQFASSS